MILDTKLAERLNTKIGEEDERAVQTMASGMLQNYGEYKYSAGYRKALADCKLLIEQTLDELMKE
jgi:hypothetical protein